MNCCFELAFIHSVIKLYVVMIKKQGVMLRLARRLFRAEFQTGTRRPTRRSQRGARHPETRVRWCGRNAAGTRHRHWRKAEAAGKSWMSSTGLAASHGLPATETARGKRKSRCPVSRQLNWFCEVFSFNLSICAAPGPPLCRRDFLYIDLRNVFHQLRRLTVAKPVLISCRVLHWSRSGAAPVN